MIRLDWIAYESNQVDLIAGTIAAGVRHTRICQFMLEIYYLYTDWYCIVNTKCCHERRHLPTYCLLNISILHTGIPMRKYAELESDKNLKVNISL
jgi:hypothetical protein